MSQEFLTFLKSVDSPQVVKDADLVRIAEALAVSFALWRILCMWHAFAFARPMIFPVPLS